MPEQFIKPRLRLRCYGWVLALLLVVAGCTPGTTRTDKDDAVAVAQRITTLMNEGVELMTKAAISDSHDIANPDEAFQLLPLLMEAEGKFNEAVRLSPISSGPRSRLGACRQAIALLHQQQYQGVKEKVDSYRKEGVEPPQELTVKMIESLEEARDWLRKSTRVLEFYVDRLMGKYPEPAIFTRLEENYFYLQEWENAENTVRRMLATFPSMSVNLRKAAESRVRQYRLRRLEAN